MSNPVILDLCSGIGGAARGLQQAGFFVVGVDTDDHSERYAGDAFHRGDATDWGLIAWLLKIYQPDAVWASWPCQAAHPLTTGTNASTRADVHKQLIPGGREVMEATGLPWVIENTAGAPIRKDLRLVGDMFREPDGSYPLGVWRPRYFELDGFTVPQPAYPKKRGRVRGMRHGEVFDGPYLAVYGEGGGKATLDEARVAMEMPWAGELKEVTEAIPPRYSHYIGTHLRRALERAA